MTTFEQELAYYSNLPVIFNGFMELLPLTDGTVTLVCVDKKPAIPEKKWVPSYAFGIYLGDERIGDIDLRVGYTESLYYGGQIGYSIHEEHRGHGYAAAACRLLVPVIKAHGMKTVLITNNITNTASRRVCEKLGAKLLRQPMLPDWHDLYHAGQRQSNIFAWEVPGEGEC